MSTRNISEVSVKKSTLINDETIRKGKIGKLAIKTDHIEHLWITDLNKRIKHRKGGKNWLINKEKKHLNIYGFLNNYNVTHMHKLTRKHTYIHTYTYAQKFPY